MQNESGDLSCGVQNFSELSAGWLVAESDFFTEHSLQPAFADEVSSAEFLSMNLTFDLRQHERCLAEICKKIEDACKTVKTQREATEQFQKCRSNADLLLLMQRQKAQTVLAENIARKNRTLVQETFLGIEVRSRNYFLPKLLQLIDEFDRFSKKVTLFLANPL
ncbi:MAG: hypothetical protein K9M51_04020 [Candidatus Gracilibacteria bacterium]|nr:hypothetical protein [Candidatus Gracilibacteria bacterium]